jgi:hypothetical protein
MDDVMILPAAPLRARGLAAGLIAASALYAAPASAMRDFRDWTAACDNLRTCTAYGFDADVGGGAYLRIERGGAADAPLRITVAVNTEDNVKFELSFDDPAIAGLPSATVAGTTNKDDDLKRLVITNPQVTGPMIEGLRKAKKLIVTRVDPPGATPSDPAVTEISLSGFAAALLWIDEQQKRVGTVTAIIGRGDKPASAVPALPAAPVVTAAKAGIGAKPDPKKAPAAALAKAQKVCDSTERFTEAEDATRLDATSVMYWFHCKEISGAYNYAYALLVVAPGKAVQIASFKTPRELGGDTGSDDNDTSMNPTWDDASRTLALLSKGRGLTDCGTTSEWAWDGAAFRMITSKAMPACKGVPTSDWPSLFRAERK